MKYFYYLEKPEKCEIKFEKENLNLNSELYNLYDKQKYEISQLFKNNEQVKKYFNKNDPFLFNTLQILFKRNNFNINKCVCLRSDDLINFNLVNFKGNIICEKIETCNKKYEYILQNMISVEMFNKIKNMKHCQREDFIFNYKIKYISYFFDILEIGGSVLIGVFNFCNPNTINIIYLLSLMFEKIILFSGTYIYCQGFLYLNSEITKEQILNLIDKSFTITNKKDIDNFIDYINNNIQENVKINKKLLNLEFDNYIGDVIEKFFLKLDEANINPNDEILENIKIDLIKNQRRIFIDTKVKKIHSAIKSPEMELIIKTIVDNNFKKCLEIGMAFGVSAISILSNKKCNLISIDPNQSTQWESNGVKLVKSLGYEKRHELIEKKSYEALPELLKNNKGLFDFIFIDGWHTFDYTLVDFFYSNLLLKINGIIIIDDAMHFGVSSFVKYLNKNYLFYKKIDSIKTIAIYKKIKEDNRDWNFHSFF